MGDAGNNRVVSALDVSLINTGIPCFTCADDDRRDIDGNGYIANLDVSATNPQIVSFAVPKPCGH